MVGEYSRGQVVLAGLRGRSAFSFLEQAAQDAARRSSVTCGSTPTRRSGQAA
jgi:hypothetical protein